MVKTYNGNTKRIPCKVGKGLEPNYIQFKTKLTGFWLNLWEHEHAVFIILRENACTLIAVIC